MTEREYLLTAAVALLLVGLLRHYAPAYRRMGLGGCRLMVAGILLPLLDPLVAFAVSPDRIAFLAHPPFLGAPLHGLALIAAMCVLAAFVQPARTVRRMALWLTAGYALHLGLRLVTPAGVPLLAPYGADVVRLPLLPVGHPLLLGLLVTGLVAVEALRRLRPWLVPALLALCVVYLVVGAAAAGVVRWQVRGLGTPDGTVHVYPGNAWLTHWLVVWEGPDAYRFRRYSLLSRTLPEPTRVARWNDQPQLLRLLSDPVVRRFYYAVFRHPVVRIDVVGSEVTLLMQEAADLVPPVPGRTFYLETDLRGSERFYQLQRFQ